MKFKTSRVAGNFDDITCLLCCSNMMSFEQSIFSNVLSPVGIAFYAYDSRIDFAVYTCNVVEIPFFQHDNNKAESI